MKKRKINRTVKRAFIVLGTSVMLFFCGVLTVYATEGEFSTENIVLQTETVSENSLNDAMENSEQKSEVLETPVYDVENTSVIIIDSGECGDNLTWTLDEEGLLTISGTGDMWDWGDPNSAEGAPWRKRREKIKELIIEEGVTSIGDNAFMYCGKLRGKLIIPEGVTRIGEYAFSQCDGFSGDLIIPDSVTEIGSYAFETCAFDGNLFLSNELIKVCTGAFLDNSFVGELDIPETVTYIGGYAFTGCDFTGTLELPEKLTFLGHDAFGGCSGFTGNLVIPEGIKEISSGSFAGCSGFDGSLVLPDGLETIGYGAFIRCDGFTGDLIIPNSVKNIEINAFMNCRGFTGSLVLPDNIENIGASAFAGCSGLTGTLTIPEGVASLEDDVFSYCSNLNGIVVLPNSVEEIKERAFYETNILIVYGDIGSYAEIYAKENNITFIPLATTNRRVSYELNGGINSPQNKEEYVVGLIHKIFAPTREGYTFEGWYTTPDFQSGSEIFGIISGNSTDEIHLFAKWEEIDRTIDSMTYMAMSELAYNKNITNRRKWNKNLGNKDNCKLYYPTKSNTNASGVIQWDEIYMQYLDGWKIAGAFELPANGFAAVWLENEEIQKAVIAFRGSGSLFNWDSLNTDWADNIRYGLYNDISQQLSAAFWYAGEWKEFSEAKGYEVSLTGHSLGGGLAMATGAYYDLEANAFDASPSLDVVYYRLPFAVGNSFHGIDKWKMWDDMDEYCYVGGMEADYKNYRKHDDLNIGSAIDVHQRYVIIEEDNGTYKLSEEVARNYFEAGESFKKDVNNLFVPLRFQWKGPIYDGALMLADALWQQYFNLSSHISLGGIIMGTSYGERLESDWVIAHTEVCYGGDGNDTIDAGKGDDTLVGGEGNDILIGGTGDDTYYYNKGDGWDYIKDVEGNDKIILLNMTEDDILTLARKGRYYELKCNDSLIMTIDTRKKSGKLTIEKCYIRTGDTEATIEEIANISDISDYIIDREYRIACPVMVEILDSEGTIVQTIPDAVMEPVATEYGLFFSSFDGTTNEVVKQVFLYDESYSIRVIACQDGNVDIAENVYGESEQFLCYDVTDIAVKKGDRLLFDEEDETKIFVDRVTGDDTEIELNEVIGYEAESLLIDKENVEMEVGESEQLNATLVQDGEYDSIEEWMSSNPEVATVKDGRITALSVGETEIYAVSINGLLASCKVKVTGKLEIPTINWNVEEKISPDDVIVLDCVTEQAEIYYTLDGSVPTKDSIKFTEGFTVTEDTVVKAIAICEGYENSDCVEYVLDCLETSLLLNINEEKKAIYLLPEAVYQIDILVAPDLVDGEKISWSIENTDVADIDEEGTVTAKSFGTTKLVAEYKVGYETYTVFYDVIVTRGERFTVEYEDTYCYTGQSIKPQVKVYDGDVCLKIGVDYSVSYKNTVNVNDSSAGDKAPMIIIKGKGNYDNQVTVTYNIVPKEMSDEDVIVSDLYAKANNRMQKKIPSVTWNGKRIRNNLDYTVEYPDIGELGAYKEPGTYDILVKGKGNFTGEKIVTLTITGNELISKAYVGKIEKQAYTGSEITPELIIRHGLKELVKDEDYTVVYKNNIEIGTATATITGVGNFSGTKTVIFEIEGTAISKVTVTGIPTSVVYCGEAVTTDSDEWEQELILTVKTGDVIQTLVQGTDYEISYQNNIDKGIAKITFTGINAYSGKITKTFRINAYNICEDTSNKMRVSLENEEVNYAKGGSSPKPIVMFGDVVLTENKDYTLRHINNTKINDGSDESKMPTIIITGKGNFCGTLEKTFTIIGGDISELEMETGDKVFVNVGGMFESEPEIVDTNGQKLEKGKDYSDIITYCYKEDTTLADGMTVRKAGDIVEEEDIIPTGTVIEVIAVGTGDYKGFIKSEYRIVEYDISKARVSVEKQDYTGYDITLDAEDMTVKYGDKELVLGTDYEIVSYEDNINRGKAKVTIRGIGNYGGTKTIKFTIKSKLMEWWEYFVRTIFG